MKIDIIGSKFSRKLTEFKNFSFNVNNVVEEQSILSLLSKPYETTMKELNTTDLNDITIAYRDLNKLLYPEFLQSNSEIIMIDLLSELNGIIEYEGAYYNASSFDLLTGHFSTSINKLSNIQKFRTLYQNIGKFVQLLNQYEKVIFLKILPKKKDDQLFVEGVYKLLEDRIGHKLMLTIDNSDFDTSLNAPIEVYSAVNQDLKKFSSDNYYNQLLFDESLENNTLSVYINYVEKREYIYELYKDGKPFKKSQPTTSRYYEYKLPEAGKYRIRVNVMDESVNSRFSLTYEYFPHSSDPFLKAVKYIEIPEKNNQWMLDVILQNDQYEGLIGNPYQYPEGYDGYPVYLNEEINDEYLKKEELLLNIINIMSKMSNADLSTFIERYSKQIQQTNNLLFKFLSSIHEIRG